MISTHAFAEDSLARAGVPALNIDPSGSRKAHYFRDDTEIRISKQLYVFSSKQLLSTCNYLMKMRVSRGETRIFKMNLRIFCKAIT